MGILERDKSILRLILITLKNFESEYNKRKWIENEIRVRFKEKDSITDDRDTAQSCVSYKPVENGRRDKTGLTFL